MTVTRCPWSGDNPLMIAYHDEEWGVPLHDDDKLFEFLVLDAFQAGLSWQMILKKRENLRRAFNNFNPAIIATYDQQKLDALLKDESIIRNRVKVNATIVNARAFLDVKKEFGTFDRFIWSFTDGKTINNRRTTISGIPATTKESDAMSQELKKRGFKFVGSTICYSFMQACGMVNDHILGCFRYDLTLNPRKPHPPAPSP